MTTRSIEQQENEQICEKLLGWHRWHEPGKHLQWKNVIDGGRGWTVEDTPFFTTWADAGLILDALHARESQAEVWNCIMGWLCRIDSDHGDDEHIHESGPLAIRAAALAHIQSLR